MSAGTAAGGEFNSTPTARQVLAQDPGYAFQLQQGTQALQRAEAAGGSVGSGGALKAIMRDSPQARSVAQARFAAEKLSAAVDAAAERAGPDAVAALKAGREATVAKYQAQDFQKAIGFKDVGTSRVEPGSAVDLVTKLTRDSDRSIALLRSVQEHAPEHIPAIAQSFVQGLIDKGTRDAGMDAPKAALSAWLKMGPETKSILFKGREQGITDWLTLNKKMAENPNPSGSGSLLMMGKAGLMTLHNPVTGIATLLGGKALAKVLFTPTGARNLIAGMKLPANSGRIGATVAADILNAAGAEASPVRTTPNGPSTTVENGGMIADGGSVRGGTSGIPAEAGGVVRGSNSIDPAGSGGAAGARTGGGARGSGGRRVRSADTNVPVAGQPGAGYQAQYKLRELKDLQASHNGNNFNRNPNYALQNDRDYTNVVNQRKVVDGASREAFRPAELINTNPDATSGPLVTDANGHVLGGNGRKRILDRVYSGNPEGVAAYRELLKSQAEHFGLDPAAVDAMKQPVLVREISDSELAGPNAKQNAVTDFNKKGTADLTPGERAIADSRRVSTETLDDMAARLDAKGPKATVADALAGKAGGEVLQKLIADGVITPQEQASLVDARTDELTKAGRERIGQLMIGRFFSDPAQLDRMAPSMRGRVERIAAPLAQVEAKPGWDLTPDVQAAIDITDQARKLGIKSIDDFIKQDGLFGKDKYSANAVTLAKALQTAKSAELTAAARQYAQDAAYAAKGTQTLMGDAPTPTESFAESFGKLKSGAQSDAAAVMKKKPIGEMARLPEISERRDAEFNPDSTTRFHIGRSTFEPIALDNKDADVIPHTSAHVANSHLIEFLGRAVGRPLNDAWHKVGAFHFAPEQLSDLRTAIEEEARTSTATGAPVMAKLKQTIQNAQQNDQSLVFSKDHASLSPELRQAVFDQELNHVRQRLLGPTAEHLGDSAASFVSSPIGMKAKATLEKTLEYSFKNDHLAALEIGERLMRPGAYKELGISGAERDVLADQYMRSLKKEYGDRAQNVIDRIRKASRP